MMHVTAENYHTRSLHIHNYYWLSNSKLILGKRDPYKVIMCQEPNSSENVHNWI